MHTQLPPTHACPAPHAAEDPHLQTPAVEQLFAIVESHAAQAAPPTAHVAKAGAVHVAPEQQPLAQLVEVQLVQTWFAQFWGGVEGQMEHPVPPEPHA